MKECHCAHGRKQMGHIPKEETASLTVYLESIFITSVIDAKEEYDVAIIDQPSAFLLVNNLDPRWKS